MHAVFRVDASIDIGAGHVMRCLTLGNLIHSKGGRCTFLCREHRGNLNDKIKACGHAVVALPSSSAELNKHHETEAPSSKYQKWLGCPWFIDAKASSAVVETIKPEWLIVDHYALDKQWEDALRALCKKILVIDDLKNRRHTCDLLLDQTYRQAPDAYQMLTPAECKHLIGTRFALLRPEFAELRQTSLKRRSKPDNTPKHILVTMGGVDKDNYTLQVLRELKKSILFEQLKITVVMGREAPWIDDVRVFTRTCRADIEVKVDVTDMAQLMSGCDLAIGAAGSSTWERCCLGLPTILLVIADNQKEAAHILSENNIAMLIPDGGLHHLADILQQALQRIDELSAASAAVVDGLGAYRVLAEMEALS